MKELTTEQMQALDAVCERRMANTGEDLETARLHVRKAMQNLYDTFTEMGLGDED